MRWGLGTWLTRPCPTGYEDLSWGSWCALSPGLKATAQLLGTCAGLAGGEEFPSN